MMELREPAWGGPARVAGPPYACTLSGLAPLIAAIPCTSLSRWVRSDQGKFGRSEAGGLDAIG